MTKTLPIVLALGLVPAACGAPEDRAPPPPAPPAARTVAPQPPSPAPAPAQPPAPAPAPAADPMAAANALFAAGKYAEAAAAFEAVTKAQPKNAEAWFKLGYSLHMTGELDRAIAADTKAADFPQVRAAALYNLGCAHALKGNPDAAFAALNMSIDSGFDQLDILQADDDLKSLRGDPRYAALVERLTKPKA